MQLTFDEANLRDLIRPIAAEVAAAMRDDDAADGPITLPEAEAAKRLGMQPHQLRDRRLAGEIVGTKLGGRWFYETTELRDYARRNREE